MELKERIERSEAFLKEIVTHLEPKKQKQVAQANYTDGCCEVTVATPVLTQADLSYINDRIRWIQDDINYLRTDFYKHTTEGHLPKIEGATAMEKALKALGLAGDYEVEKKTIYANDGTVSSISFALSPKK